MTGVQTCALPIYAASGCAEEAYDEAQSALCNIVSYSAIDDIDTQEAPLKAKAGIDQVEISCIAGVPFDQINVHTPENEPDYD